MNRRTYLIVLLLSTAIMLIALSGQAVTRAGISAIGKDSQQNFVFTMEEGDTLQWEWNIVGTGVVDFWIEDGDGNVFNSMPNSTQASGSLAISEDGDWTIYWVNQNSTHGIQLRYDVSVMSSQRAFTSNDWLLFAGAILIIFWGIGHIVPTKSIIEGFGRLDDDNHLIIKMSWVAEGLAMVFIGLLVMVITIFHGSGDVVARTVFLSCAAMLFAMAAWTAMTGSRTSALPMKLCPVIKSITAVLLIVGSLM
jgi:hypothetical protein